MKYNLNGKDINIPDATIEKSMASLGIDKAEAIELYLFDQGLVSNEAVEEMTAKAKAFGPVTRNQEDKPKRKPPERKPDMVKREVIEMLAGFVRDQLDPAAEVTNIERMIAFTLDGDKFEITLTKKRKPKK